VYPGVSQPLPLIFMKAPSPGEPFTELVPIDLLARARNLPLVDMRFFLAVMRQPPGDNSRIDPDWIVIPSSSPTNFNFELFGRPAIVKSNGFAYEFLKYR
jgi:hypothetical protein